MASPDPADPAADRALASLPLAWGNPQVSPDPDLAQVLSARALAFRNFAGLPFIASAPPDACSFAADRALDMISRRGGLTVRRLADCLPRLIRLLREREILPPRAMPFPGKKGYKYLALAPDAAGWILVNEVEHVTFGRVFPGCPSPEEIVSQFRIPEDAVSPTPWARSRSLGYLASDPSRLGPGISLDVVVHLPGLVLSRQLPQAANFLTAAGFGFLPVCNGPASAAAEAALFRLIARGRLGKNLPGIHADLLRAVRPILRRESEARRQCLEKLPKRLEERVQRALQALTDSASLSYADMLAHGSLLRLGAGLGMASPGFPWILEELRVTAGSGHLSVTSGRDLSKEEEDFARSDIVRSSLKNNSGEIT